MSPSISRDVLFDVPIDPVQTTQHIEARRIRLAPGYAPGPHVHNGPVVGNIVEGSVVFQIEDEPPAVLEAGDVFFEPAGAVITRFDAQDSGAVFLAYFPLGAGQQSELRSV
jgi:quercetin dioxygenase-like cupin family protein